jgi:hypothetical protein
LVCFAGVLAVGIVAAVAWPPVYRSMATILIEQQEIPQDLVRSTISSFADQRIQLINQRVMTTANLLEIIREHGLYAEDFDRVPREVIIDRMRDAISMDTISANVVDPRSGQPVTATTIARRSSRRASPTSSRASSCKGTPRRAASRRPRRRRFWPTKRSGSVRRSRRSRRGSRISSRPTWIACPRWPR